MSQQHAPKARVSRSGLGTTEYAHKFGREVENQLRVLAERGTMFGQTAMQPDLQELFEQYRISRFFIAGPCRVVCLTSRKDDNIGNQHHWIVVDFTGFHSDFFALVTQREGRKNASRIFIKQYFSFVRADANDWANHFHLHFVRAAKVQPSMEFWREFVIEEHKLDYNNEKPSNLGFIRSTRSHLWEIDTEGLSTEGSLYVGFKPVHIVNFYKDCQKVLADISVGLNPA